MADSKVMAGLSKRSGGGASSTRVGTGVAGKLKAEARSAHGKPGLAPVRKGAPAVKAAGTTARKLAVKSTGPRARSKDEVFVPTQRVERVPAAPAAVHPVRAGGPVDLRAAVAGTVEGLGYDCVDVERFGRNQLRVTIDRLPGRRYVEPGTAVTVEDCEAVSRQLQYALEVDGLDYSRLEISSPGLDRPLRREADYARFSGESVVITLREPFNGRKKYQGLLSAAEPASNGWQLLLDAAQPGPTGPLLAGGLPAKPTKAATKAAQAIKDEQTRAASARAKARAGAKQVQEVLTFQLAEVRDARLVPVLNFKGRQAAGTVQSSPKQSPHADEVAAESGVAVVGGNG